MVYATHTGTRDIPRMDDILTRHGFRVAVMKADAVAPERRKAWVRVKQGIDVMICHPRLVQTGLDLIDFPTLIWHETDYSVYVRQASRRSWRIGQGGVSYEHPPGRRPGGEEAAKLPRRRGSAAGGRPGRLRRRRRPDDGAGPEDRQRGRGGGRDGGGGLRPGQGRRGQRRGIPGLEGRVEEPEAAPANGNGADAIGPTVELVLTSGHHANGNGHAAVEVNGNGPAEAPEPATRPRAGQAQGRPQSPLPIQRAGRPVCLSYDVRRTARRNRRVRDFQPSLDRYDQVGQRRGLGRWITCRERNNGQYAEKEEPGASATGPPQAEHHTHLSLMPIIS